MNQPLIQIVISVWSWTSNPSKSPRNYPSVVHAIFYSVVQWGGHWWTRDIYPITAVVEDKRNSSSNNGTEVSVLDQVFCAVSTVECQAASSWSTRDHTVLSEIPELTRESDPVQFQRRQHPLLNLHLLGFRSGLDIIEKPTMKCPAAR